MRQLIRVVPSRKSDLILSAISRGPALPTVSDAEPIKVVLDRAITLAGRFFEAHTVNESIHPGILQAGQACPICSRSQINTRGLTSTLFMRRGEGATPFGRFGIVPFLGCLEGAWVAGVLSTPILASSPSLGLHCCYRKLAVVGAGQELRVQKRGKDGVPCLGIETEQAPGLRRGELETGHLEIFRADSAQQFRE